jgi:uncharacterized membrane protein YozB (DUF420 family)
VVVFPGPEPGESKLVYACPHDRMDNEYKYPTAYKPSYYPVLYQKIRLETGKIVLVLYKTIIASLVLY